MASKGSSSGIEVVPTNSPAIPVLFHPLVMIGTAFADVKKFYMFTIIYIIYIYIYIYIYITGHEVVLM